MRNRCGYMCCLAVLTLTCSTSCSKPEQVTRYSAPRTESSRRAMELMQQSTSDATSKEADRMLAAIVPRGAKTWFLKLQGPVSRVDAETSHFSEFVQSLKFSGESDTPDWKLPEGWRRLPGTDMRFATLQIGPAENALELSVIPLPTGHNGLDAYILSNINRWREQIALSPVGSLDAMRGGQADDALTETKLTDGTAVWLINMLGAPATIKNPRAGLNSRLPPSHPPIGTAILEQMKTPSNRDAPLTFDAPPQWTPGKAGGMRQAAFQVVDGDQRVEITVIALAQSGGDRLANVNRWREQMNQPAVAADKLAEVLKPIDMHGRPGDYVEIFGTGADARPSAILGAMVDDGGRTWFFKLTGDKPLAERESSRFQAFVASVQFSSATKGKHE